MPCLIFILGSLLKTMKYTKKTALALLNKLTGISNEVFGNRLVSTYALGSLAHGGFSAKMSDIDFLVILADPINSESDTALIAEIKKIAESRNLPLANRISIFWSSINELQNVKGQGRMPAVDKLDFILNAKLLSGKDIRDVEIPRPTQFDLDISGVTFITEVFFSDHFRLYIIDPYENILKKQDAIALVKTILFPARLLYTLETGKIGDNKSSAEYYLNNHQNEYAQWIKKAYRWRTKQPDFSNINPEDLMIAINSLYTHMIECYITRMSKYGEDDLVQKLKRNISHDLLT